MAGEEISEKTIADYSLRPPTLGSATAGASVLLDLRAYVADHGNATTAKSKTRSGQPIEVSFWTAPPPRVSYMCVHCPGLDPNEFATEPKIVATDADLVLFRVALGPQRYEFMSSRHDYFVYQATTSPPSLRLIPPPPVDNFVGLLRCGSVRTCPPNSRILGLHPHTAPDDGTYIVAALCNTSNSGHVLHLYHSDAKGWTSHSTSIHGLVDPKAFSHFNTKVITVGGEVGTMGWVDIDRGGILFCDLLRDTTKLHYFALPPPLYVDDDILVPDPGPLRDIALVHGRIKYIGMQVHARPHNIKRNTYISQGWIAATWSAPATNPWKHGWRQDFQLVASNLSVDDDTMNFELLPKLFNDQATPQQTLERLHVGLPTISLHSDDVVCFMAKVDLWDRNAAWVLAVDMKNMKLIDVAEYDAQRTLGISFAYMSSRISGYLPTAAPGKKSKLKRQGVVLTVPSYKKQSHMVHLSPPSWKGGDQQNSGTSKKREGDNMDLDLYIKDASPYPPVHKAKGGLSPSWVLFDRVAYIAAADLRNATAAVSNTRDGHEIRVIQCTSAEPPLVSYMCVHSPTLDPSRDFAMEPEIIAAHDDLLLFRLALGHATVEPSADLLHRSSSIPLLSPPPLPR
uniref:DUF1618 domain-containing protein n=1 Tax=Leersia perrieri TaxID=77586 RepID=A0A0D9XGX0_9ORYZ